MDTTRILGRGGIARWGIMLLALAVLPSARIALADSVTPISVNAHLRANAYFFQVGDDEQNRAPIYEVYDLGVGGLAEGRVDLRVAGRFATDFALDDAIDPAERLYAAYADLRLPRYDAKIRVGRQFLHEGSSRHLLDGAWIQYAPSSRWKLHLWGGADAPRARTFEFASPGDETVLGARVIASVHRQARVSAWLSSREYDGEYYSRPFGGEVLVLPYPGVRALVRGTYDLEREESLRYDLMTTVDPGRGLPSFRLQMVDRRPQIEPGSYFQLFADDIERVQILRATSTYELSRDLGLEGEAFSSWVDDRSTQRLGLALVIRHARVGFSKRFGDAGDEYRVYGDARWHPIEWLSLSAGAMFAEYALIEDATSEFERDYVTTFINADVEWKPGTRFSVELQSLENSYYESDVRLLLGLDLWAGRGTSRYGWAAGGER